MNILPITPINAPSCTYWPRDEGGPPTRPAYRTRGSSKTSAIWRAPTRIILLLFIMMLAFLGPDNVSAQVSLSASNACHSLGEYSLSYFRSNIDITPLIGKPGSNYWNFSQPQASNEVVSRMDVVSTSVGPYGTNFPAANFAWQYNGGAIEGTSWEYYSLDASNGLVFYGIYYPTSYEGVEPLPITPQVPVLPATVFYGQTWTTQYQFTIEDLLFGDVPGLYQATNNIDAYGTLQLPGLEPVPALRIAEVETYFEQDILFGGWDVFQQDTNWLWLAEGLGFAVQADSFAPNAVDPADQPYTNSFSREFVSPISKPAPKVTITLNAISNSVKLSWGALSNVDGYLIEYSTNLSAGAWLPVSQTTSNTLSVPMPNQKQTFIRVRSQSGS